MNKVLGVLAIVGVYVLIYNEYRKIKKEQVKIKK